MKKVIWILTVVILVVGLVIGSSMRIGMAVPDSASIPSPEATVINPVSKLERNVMFVVIGSGFEPGQEVHFLLLEPTFGTTTDLDWSVDPKPVVANDSGAWIVTWDTDRYVQRKLVVAGVYSILVTDSDFNTLTTTAFAFWDAEKPPEEWPIWAQALSD